MVYGSERALVGGGAAADAGSEAATAVSLIPIIQAGAILLIGVAIIIANVLVIATLIMSPSQRDAMVYYVLSLAAADLLCGILVVPLSVYPAVGRRWVYGEFVCRIEGYLEVCLWSVSVYTFMWISVDRYLAVKKPLRYETLQTRTRCQCWMVFTWITAAFLCCPPLLGFSTASYYEAGALCLLEWSNMIAYSLTLAALVLGPSLITVIYTHIYIFHAIRKARRPHINPADKEHVAAVIEVAASAYHPMSLTLVLVFWMSWLPWLGLCAYEQIIGKVDMPLVHFSLIWLGVLNCFWKTIIYITMNPEFRSSLRFFCTSICCCVIKSPRHTQQQQMSQQPVLTTRQR
uniref:G-protein coupled receptors family 1 profile domain-containing protein n=1 Tax=Strigamia maritima TaxID=126957 RepID=T1JA05_STRMM